MKHSVTREKYTYFVKGMHCPSCEILMQWKLPKFGGIKSAKGSTAAGTVTIEYEGERPTARELSEYLGKDGYTFSEEPLEQPRVVDGKTGFATVFLITAILVGLFALTERAGLAALISINATSALPAFFLLGVVAGLSSCAALVGGIVLSMAKQWSALHSRRDPLTKRLQPHLLFNAGRLFLFAVLGAVLGAAGGALRLSAQVSPLLVIGISLVMVLLGLQILGIKAFQGFQLSLPRRFTGYAANETNFKGRFMPFLMGGLTFFLPCGFTLTAQGLALLSGNALQGGLIMLLFALGTSPMLLLIGISSVKFLEKPHLSTRFLKVAGVLVLFFAAYNINSQLNVLGIPSLSNLLVTPQAQQSGYVPKLPPVVNGEQLIRMDATAYGYRPNRFLVKAGIPVRWEIKDVGTSGCTNAIISRALFDGQIPLTRGQTSVREFTPTTAGMYKFSCWMGMIWGVIEVVDG